jgi:MFS family permease
MSPPEVKRTVRTFAWASFLHDMGADMIFSVWPLYLRNVLGANMAAIGFIDGLGEAVVSISGAIAGYLSDRWGKRKLFVWLGYFCGGLARIGYALSTSWMHLIPWRILDRSGKMRTAPRDAIVADISDEHSRGRNFGFLRLMDNGGALCGIVLSIILVQYLPYRTIFLIATIPSFAAALYVYIRAPERTAKKIRTFRGISLKNFSTPLRLYTLSSALLELGTFSYSFLILAATADYFPAWSAPIFYFAFTFMAAAVSLPFGILSDRIGRKNVLWLSMTAWAAMLILMLVSNHPAAIIAAVLLYGVQKGALDPVQRSFVTELADPSVVASTIGGFNMVIGLCSLPASFMAGILWDAYGPEAAFTLSLSFTAASACILIFVKQKNMNT